MNNKTIKKIKHKYICKQNDLGCDDTVAFLIGTNKGHYGKYLVFDKHNKFKILRQLVELKRSCIEDNRLED